jgi:sorbose reductase
MPPAPTDRDALTTRILPHMTFSDGTPSSLTGPPAPTPHHLSSEERAKLRFAVKGNAIVTGGAGALGLLASRALLEHGLSGIMIFDVNPQQIQSALTELTADFPVPTIAARFVDITDEVAINEAVAETVEVLGSVDILLCFAGVVACTHALEMTAAEWRRTLDINTTGSFLTAQAVAKVMVKQGAGGSIVFTASISGHRVNFPQPQVAYNVSKAALLTLKDCLAAEWARYGIRCNSISPGYMDTILNEGPGLAEARAIWASRNPMGRMGVPSELTGSIVLLCSQAGTYINGADIVIDGGATVF